MDEIVELTRKIDNATTDSERASLLVSRGRLLWKIDHRREAINDYSEAAELDPEGPASALLEHSMEIINFFNPDLYNP